MIEIDSTQEHVDSIAGWLKQHHFTANPFTMCEAELETRLEEYFVEGPFHKEILGLDGKFRTTMVFASRGEGKSAYRMMIQNTCRPYDDQADILAIPYVGFEEVVEAGEDFGAITTDSHLTQILRLGTLTLFEELSRRPEQYDGWSPKRQRFFKWLVKEFSPELKDEEYVLDELIVADRLRVVDSEMLGEIHDGAALIMRKLQGTEAGLPPGKESIRYWVTQLLLLVRQLGLQGAYVLIDGVDELSQTTDNPEQASRLLRSILGDLKLMRKTPHLAFKVFLPAELRQYLEGSGDNRAVRLDRIASYGLEWGDDCLQHMLQSRIRAFNTRGISSLGEIATEDIAGSIDRELVQHACGRPRDLFLLADILLKVHCWSDSVELRLTSDDLDAAVIRFRDLYGVPLLRLDEHEREVFVGGKLLDKQWSPLEYDLLSYLYQSPRTVRSKDEIYLEVYETEEGVSDQAIDSLVFRLRRKIESNPKKPVYLITERGKGYRLDHTDN